jgi:tetratricopeptide (TPR) repeat protein
MGRYAEALADFNYVIGIDPEDTLILSSRGITYGLMGRYEEALADLNTAIGLCPDLAWMIQTRGIMYREIGRFAEALDDLKRSLYLDPEDANAQFELGLTYWLLTERDIARTALRRAVDLGTQKVDSRGATLPRLIDLALYHAALGHSEQSMTLLTRAVALPHAAEYIHYAALRDSRSLHAVMRDNADLDSLVQFLFEHASGD